MKRTLSKTKLELLENTIARYNSNNRAETSRTCCYIMDDGRRCAIGAEVSKPVAIELERRGGSLLMPRIFGLLPNRLIKMGQGYLRKIQALHDGSDYWNEHGLSTEGEEMAKAIREEYGL